MTSEYGDRSNRPAPHLSHRTTLFSVQELDADRVPEGTVASRILRLQQLARQGPNSPPPPFSERDRDSESSSWGRRTEGQVSLIQPASHVKAIDVKHDIPRRVVSSYFQRPSTLSAIPETNAAPLPHRTPSVTVLRRLPRMASNSSRGSPPSTASSRFEDARQILQEHRISLPRG